MKFKMAVCSLLLVCLVLLFSACSSSEDSNTTTSENGKTNRDEDVKLTFYTVNDNNTFSEIIKAYEEVKPEVEVEMINAQAGLDYIQKYEALQASGNAPTLAMLEPATILKYKDSFLDLETEKEKYQNLTLSGTVERNLFEGKFLGVPFTTQGYGLLFNTRVVEEAIGGKFDPESINTQEALAGLFEKIKASGTTPVIIHGANWSLGSHYMGLNYALQSKSNEDNLNYIEGLKNGEVDLSNDNVLNGLIDTFDILKEYNLRYDDPLVANIEHDGIDFARGNAAFYFMGDWAWANIQPVEGHDKEYGIIPVPISNDPSQYGNNEIPVSEPFLFSIDNTKSSPEQQQAAKDFIEFMVTSEEGQSAFVNLQRITMPYKDVKVESDNLLSPAIQKYAEEGNTINIGIMKYLPGDHYAEIGSVMQKYLTDNIDRQGFIEEFGDYWQSKGE
ncbi:ABC transporter substrate-binding protein [Aquibacillus koreensis]|uniref:ABC transporter substrate-binding protein n=1 Tax=Aquibacillus koreensis TaxID=279446 RepID=A0A9X3WQE9_9BACI|nr:ABC transporter substrate-binding protein [Aquibacillus koreensis]MCT2536715.1 ABC transporter substrate-binding protein [Aquibacillus koreensis]MDC3421529.1 ABC transporter substrate-binding protein [Aquibacillus koreensis]